MKSHSLIATTFMTSCLLALSMLGGCGKTGQSESSSVDKSQNVTQETKQESDNIATAGKPLTMEDKDRVLSLEELQKYSDKYYINSNMVDYDEGEIIIDAYGNVSTGRDVGNLYVKKILDPCNNEVLYYKECYVTISEKKQSEYYETEGIPHSRLYDVKGNLLFDWEEVDYGAAHGDWIVKATYSIDSTFETPDGQRTLFNVKDSSTMDGVSDIASMDTDKARLMDDAYNTVAVLDQEGNILFKDLLKDMQDKNVSLNMKNGYYYTLYWGEDDQKCFCTFFDKDNNKVFSMEENDYIDFYEPNTVGPYIIYDSSDGDQVLDLRGDGNGGPQVLYKAGNVTYYDGERIVADHNGDDQFGLFDADGNQLASYKGRIYPENATIDQLYFETSNDLQKAETFLAVDGNTVKRIDRDGNEVASFQLSTSGVNIDDIEIYDEGIFLRGDDFESAGLLSKDLEETIPFKRYTNSYYLQDEVTGISYLYVTDKEKGIRNDKLYTMSGELVLSDFNVISVVKDGKVSVHKGKYFGLVDLDGQWIYKYSVIDYMDYWM